MRWICILTLLALSGCVAYKEVSIPTSCEVPIRERPIRSGNVIDDFKAILIYSEGIEQDLKFCIKK